MTPAELLAEVEDNFRNRKFAAGLALAFIDFLVGIGAINQGLRSYEDLLSKFPRRDLTSQGKPANTLIVTLPEGSTRSIRPYYNKVEQEIRAKHQRLGYPSAAPHATQAWPDYRHWLGALVRFKELELKKLRQQILDFILRTLPSHEVDSASLTKDAPVFLRILESFDFARSKGEPTGAAFQGAVFAYHRADAPHLQVEVRKVRTGSKRVGGVGDIDAWEGDRLIISAEAKHYKLTADVLPDLAGFADAVLKRKAIGIVVAEDFEEEVRRGLKDRGLVPLSRQQLVELVSLWDPIKQRIAAQAFIYYASHVEQNAALAARIQKFVTQLTPE